MTTLLPNCSKVTVAGAVDIVQTIVIGHPAKRPNRPIEDPNSRLLAMGVRLRHNGRRCNPINSRQLQHGLFHEYRISSAPFPTFPSLGLCSGYHPAIGIRVHVARETIRRLADHYRDRKIDVVSIAPKSAGPIFAAPVPPSKNYKHRLRTVSQAGQAPV